MSVEGDRMRPNATHDPALRSWVDSANADGADFPIQNLPYGRFRLRGSAGGWRIGVAIGAAFVGAAIWVRRRRDEAA